MSEYNPKEIESKWQKIWYERGIFKTPEKATKKNKMYILPQLPYPSGSGLHVGHAEVYTACDIFARFQRMNGKKVLQVIGWDSFGLPAENYAIKTNVHPRESTNKAIDSFRVQLKRLGISVDWDREVGSHNPDYYKWTQWFFLLMYKRGLAYRKKQSVNWCDSCKTVLANEQVAGGVCERCDTQISQKEMEQWYLKITDYAERLLNDLQKLDWPEETKKRQSDWIGRSEGAYVDFRIVCEKIKNFASENDAIKVFTTRPDTLFGATYMVLAPENEILEKYKSQITNSDEIEKYKKQASKKSELERAELQKEKTGIEARGIKSVNPVNGKEIPIWIADYVLSGYGTGAIMAVPAHDERDFEFAKKYGLEITDVVAKKIGGDLDAIRRNGAAGVVIKNDKVLVLYNKKFDVYRLPSGGYEEGETAKETIAREMKEETGFVDFVVKESLGIIESNNYSVEKQRQTKKEHTGFLIELLSEKKAQTSFEEHEDYECVWFSPKEAIEKLSSYGSGEDEFVKRAIDKSERCFTLNGISVNSGFLNGLETKEAIKKMNEWLETNGVGKRAVSYKLRDWSVSRQRFWGAPVPMLYDEKGGIHPVREKDLPVLLPDDVDFKPTGQSPLIYSEKFMEGVEKKYGKGWKREVDTLDTFMCSSWYYYRYLDPQNNKKFASKTALKKWMPVDFYLGGAEHVNGHLLYSRFFTKVLFDAGFIDFDEPFLKHRHQGLILGEDNRKMSKRWGNSVNPNDVAEEYGADTLRIYEMFMGPLEQSKPWSMNGVKGVRRFLDRVWRLQEKIVVKSEEEKKRIYSFENQEIQKNIHQLIKKVSEDTRELQFNTAIARMMEFVNLLTKAELAEKEILKTFLILLSPYAPHIAEEMWSELGFEGLVCEQCWPKFNKRLAKEDSVELVVQINGKIRERHQVSASLSDDELEKIALSGNRIKELLKNYEVLKVIVIKGKLVNIVVR